jgi:hypothetical protein
MSQSLFFYSAKCKYSTTFLEELARTPFGKEFRFVCVDATAQGRPTLPGYVKAVPTLMIKGEESPRTDTQVMNWLSERRLREKTSSLPGGSDQGLAGGFGIVGPSAFIDSELFGGGDEGYAFIGEDTGSSSGATNRLKGNMAGLDDLSSMVVADARAGVKSTSATPQQAQKSGKASGLEDAFNAFQEARKQEMGGGRRV